MKRKTIIALAFLAALAFAVNGNVDARDVGKKDCKHKHEHKKHGKCCAYTCPMHPKVEQDQPGKCPVCKMDLVKKCKHVDQNKHGKGCTFTCPMHPKVEQDQPGQCPVCHMDLIKKCKHKHKHKHEHKN